MTPEQLAWFRTQRVHYGNCDPTSLEAKPQGLPHLFREYWKPGMPLYPSHKPEGLWYAYGDSWLARCTEMAEEEFDPFRDIPDFEDGGLILAFEADARILTLRDIKDFEAFVSRYGEKDPMYVHAVSSIRWFEVADAYDGIEAHRPSNLLHPDVFWSLGWDITSGCVWNPEVIQLNPIELPTQEQLLGSHYRRQGTLEDSEDPSLTISEPLQSPRQAM